jgi:hypothetical protein
MKRGYMGLGNAENIAMKIFLLAAYPAQGGPGPVKKLMQKGETLFFRDIIYISTASFPDG